MRSLRWLLLLIIAVIAAGTFQVYRLQRLKGKAAQRPAPPLMAGEDKATAIDWEWTQSADGAPTVKLTALEMHQNADAKTSRLKNIELRIYQKNGKSYIYSPFWTEEQCRELEAESFLDRVFGGELSPMLAHFVRTRRVSEEDLRELERILKENK